MSRGVVLVALGARDWPAALLATIVEEGFTLIFIERIDLVPFFVLAGGVRAVLFDVDGLVTVGPSLSRCREHAPGTALVAVTPGPAPRQAARALAGGATAVIAWPSSRSAVGRALQSAT